MKTTANYALQIPEATDTVNLLTQNYPNFETIDTAMKANKDAAITTATEVKTGTNHAILRSNTDASMFRFVATSNMVSGDTFTVDSVVCTATTPDGQSLGAGAFVINQNVLCCLTGTLLTIYAGGSASTEVEKAKTAENAEKLGGELPEYYGTADAVTANTQAIDGLTNDVSEINEKIAGLGGNYSTAEHVVGKWIDGTIDVYEKTYVYMGTSVLTNQIIDANFNSYVIDYTGCFYSTEQNNVLLPYIWKTNFYAGLEYGSSGLKFYWDGSGSTFKGYVVTVRYIKSSPFS